MDKKKVIKVSLILVNFLITAMLIWSLVNYRVLNNEVTELVEIGGITIMIIAVILLEGAPIFIGGNVAVASVMAMNIINPWYLLIIFLVSAFVGNVFYFYLGHILGNKIFSYFEEKDVKRYKKVFDRYARITFIVMALSPIPYLPSLAGAFKLDRPIVFFETLFFRFGRHIVVFLFWYFLLVY